MMQAAGRVIRSLEDKGVVLLIDDRFSSYQYRPLFPEHWQHARMVSSPSDLVNIVQLFWKEK